MFAPDSASMSMTSNECSASPLAPGANRFGVCRRCAALAAARGWTGQCLTPAQNWPRKPTHGHSRRAASDPCCSDHQACVLAEILEGSVTGRDAG